MRVGDYEAVIGLEVHVQLSTESKLFCGCSTTFGASPNTQVCATCLGYPGSLPVLNRAALRMAVRAGLAFGSTIARETKFDRKNYFYADLPKGYQISQFDVPYADGGVVSFVRSDGSDRAIRLTRIHLEEDAGKSSHDDVSPVSRIDLNRCGTPLLEMVSEPELRDAEDADGFLRTVRETVRWIAVADANMEEGSLRCDVNLSLRPVGSTELGTRTEVKNLNSFAFVRGAIEAEAVRQESVLAQGGSIVQETRLYDPERRQTVSMRSKEDAHDYRYFPEPDLPPVDIPVSWIAEQSSHVGVLPSERRRLMIANHHLSDRDAAQMTSTRELAEYFEATVEAGARADQASNWLQNELPQWMNEHDYSLTELSLAPAGLAAILAAVDSDRMSTATAREVLREVLASGSDPDGVIASKGDQLSDEGAIRSLIDQVLADNVDAVARLQGGESKVRGFLMGQVMKRSRGKINPKVANALLDERLAE